MANTLDALIGQIADSALRVELAREVGKLKAHKKFGLVFEEHQPELVQLPSLPVRPGGRVVKRGGTANEIFVVRDAINGSKVRIARVRDGQEEVAAVTDLVTVKKFGEPVYPALVPVANVVRDPARPHHALINTDNFHALQLLLYTHEGQVDVIYVDPPYNTGARDWKYNNDYVDANDQWRHSKWLSMMKKRLLLAKRLLKPTGVLIITIDDCELYHLGVLLEELFPDRDQFIITIEHNKRGRRGKNFAKSNEWAIYLVPRGVEVIQEEKLGELIGGESRNLRRTGSGAKRFERPRKFYPIWVNEKTLEVVSAGDPIPKDAKWKYQRDGNLVTVWPVDEDKEEKNWHYGVVRTRACIKEGELEARRQSYGIQVYYTLREKDSKRWKTVWSKPSLDASSHGSELVDEILAGDGDFDYPKSIYAVLDCLRAACGHLPNAIVVDFFGGSGTTYHATCLLNAEDGGRRQCILVTNNEVTEKLAKELSEKGNFPGQPKFEEHGICESVTWPRCKFVTNGRRDDRTVLPGKYLPDRQGNVRELKDGFTENIDYFRLTFLDRDAVAYGDEFEAIAPMLWLMAGALGELETARGYGKWFMPKQSPFGVLIKETAFTPFLRELESRPDVTHVFLVTDSEQSYREMLAKLPRKFTTRMLYKSYLENFRINSEAGA